MKAAGVQRGAAGRHAVCVALATWLFLLGSALLGGHAHAADANPAMKQAGAAIASRGAASAPACASCHGQAGEGNAAAGFPRLAGQSADYLVNQLNGYADGRRPNPVMTPIAIALSADLRRSVAAHYASSVPPAASRKTGAAPAASPLPAASAAAVSRGKVLATVGDESRRLQACANCHGPQGIGESGGYPYLAGQHAGYLLATLQAWKSEARRTDPSNQMPHIADALTAPDMQAVVAYYSTLPPIDAPIDRGSAAAPAARAAAGPRRTIVSGPTRQVQPTGTGSAQGGPLLGGTQGVGGPPNTDANAGQAASAPR